MEASSSIPQLTLGDAEEWYFLVTLAGVPCAYIRLPSPGAAMSGALAEAALGRHADEAQARELLLESFRRRMGAPRRRVRRPTTSVVVCTHRRPGHLADLLEALARLDPAPDEVVVVDSDPDALDSRTQAEAAGARYVREERRGLNRARAAGLRAARGELVAYTDDDCLPASTWLRSLSELFDDPTVGAVTGPAFAHAVDTAAQRAREKHASFVRGLRRTTYDWTTVRPVSSGAVGAGANMVLRRSLLDELGEVFPPELDVGTPTRSGGDLYALYKVLAAGRRVAYDPGTYVFHRHAADAASVHETVLGYGVGFSAFLTKVLVQDRELAALRAWWWLWGEYRRALIANLAGHAEPGQLRLRWNYLRGGLLGPLAWRRSLAAANGRPPARGAATARPGVGNGATTAARPSPRPGGAGDPAVSVIVCAGRDLRPRCLEALARQVVDGASFEVIVAGPPPGKPEQPREGRGRGEPVARHVRVDGSSAAARNAGAGAAQGKLLVFLDGDVVPSEDLVARHLELHRVTSAPRIVLGSAEPRAVRRNLATLEAALRWGDHFKRKREAASMTFVDVLLRNASMPVDQFERVGRLDDRLDGPRADWEWGIRTLRAGAEVVYEPDVRATHELALSTRAAIEQATRDGRDDALIVGRHPLAASSLPAWPSRRERARRPGRTLVTLILRRRGVRRLATLVLDALEWAGDRGSWARLFALTRQAAYEASFRAVGDPVPPARSRPPRLAVELASKASIPAPGVATPLVETTIAGRPATRVSPEGGQWHPRIAEQIESALEAGWWNQLRRACRPGRGDNPATGDLSGTVVVFGPGRRPGDDRERRSFEAAGARVEALDGPDHHHWLVVDRAVRASSEEIVALPLPGVTPSPIWLAALRPAMDGDRVAAVVGAGLRPDEPPGALLLAGHRTLSGFRPVGRAPQYIAVRPRVYEALGGFDLETVRFGPQGPVIDLLERVVDAHLVVAYRETPGLDPPVRYRPARSRNEWYRWQAKGGLAGRRVLTAPDRQAARRFARRTLASRAVLLGRSAIHGRPSRRHWLGTTTAFATGWVIAARAARGRDGERKLPANRRETVKRPEPS